MKLRNILAAALLAAPMVSQAATATLQCNGTQPVFRITHTLPAGDAGRPGLFWVGVTDPAQSQAAFYDINGTWWPYQGGLYPPAMAYESGIPATVQVTIPVPYTAEGGYTTYAGWTVYVGHGVLTQEAESLVRTRRETFNEMKPERVAAGKWNPEYDKDDRFKWSLAQKNMKDNGKYTATVSVPNYNPCDIGG